MRVRTLGASEILVGSNVIGPQQPMVFACLFLLALASPRPMSRARLAAELWPSSAPGERNHRFRTLLYRIRRLGVSLVCGEATIALDPPPMIDFRDYSTRPRSLADVRARAAAIGAILPGLDAACGSSVADCIDDARDVIVGTIIQWLTAALTLAKSAGEWRLVEQLARAARGIDMMNELAWLSLAEAQCLTGDRRRAVHTLDEYLTMLPEGDALSRTSALGLKRRILAEVCRRKDELPLVGRDTVMHRVWAAYARAQRGRGGALLLWGPAGVGKTRLLQESTRALVVRRARVVAADARPVHGLCALGLIRDLVTRLLDEPGAAGCDPAAYQLLRAFVMPNEHPGEKRRDLPAEALFHALTELLSALTEEGPLVITIDDIHVMDAEGPALWRALLRWSSDRAVLWLFAARALHETELATLPDATLLARVHIPALDPAAATWLLAASRVASGDDEHLLNATSGNPLLLLAAARPFDATLAACAEAAIEDTMSRLSGAAIMLLRAIAALGVAETHAIPDLAPLSTAELSAVLAELRRAGILHETDDTIRLYRPWADALLALYPISSSPMSAAMIAF